jgi:hypothetical protein
VLCRAQLQAGEVCCSTCCEVVQANHSQRAGALDAHDALHPSFAQGRQRRQTLQDGWTCPGLHAHQPLQLRRAPQEARCRQRQLLQVHVMAAAPGRCAQGALARLLRRQELQLLQLLQLRPLRSAPSAQPRHRRVHAQVRQEGPPRRWWRCCWWRCCWCRCCGWR